MTNPRHVVIRLAQGAEAHINYPAGPSIYDPYFPSPWEEWVTPVDDGPYPLWEYKYIYRPEPGLFIVIEGIDGSGTSTQAERLSALFPNVLLTHEPSNLEIGQLIRSYIEKQLVITGTTAAMLFAADRLDHIQKEIRPALNNGKTVISDRYILSSFGYQGLTDEFEYIHSLNLKALLPDLTFFLKVSPETAYKRVQERADAQGKPLDLFEAEGLIKRVASMYDSAVTYIRKNVPRMEIVTLDGEAPIELITEQIIEALIERFPNQIKPLMEKYYDD